MQRCIAAALALCGLAGAVHGEVVLRMLVSSDGVHFSSSMLGTPGSHVDVLATVSYTGDAAGIAGFGSANFQPTVSNWDDGVNGDRLSPLVQGGNVLGQSIHAQATATGVGSPNPYATPTSGGYGGPAVPAAPYAQGTYGRVYPMAEVYLDGAQAIRGFVHHNPDGSGRNYLRIAQASLPDWFNPVTNFSGGSGVNLRQLYVQGRTTSDPDFWGNRDVHYDSATQTFFESARVPGQDVRLQNIQLFRFGIDLSSNGLQRTITIDAPLAGQQRDPVTGNRYLSFYSGPGESAPGARFYFESGQAVIESAQIVFPAPGGIGVGLGACLMMARRRRSERL